MKTALTCVIVTATSFFAFGDNVYVSSNGDGADGRSWETAYKTLAAAVAAETTSEGDTVVLDDETFTLTADTVIDKKLVITSRTGKDSSIVDGANKYILEMKDDTVLHHVTLTRTGTGYGGTCAINMTGKNGVVSNCVFRQCGNDLSGNCRYIIHCLTSGHLYGNIVTNCSPPNSPAFDVSGSTLVENCLFVGNTHRAGNASVYPGLGIVANGSAVIRNCTIVNNNCKHSSSQTYGIISNSKDVTVENCIIWGNTSGVDSRVTTDWTASGDTSKWSNNCTSNADALQGSGNFSNNPLLRADGINLMAASPCRGAANANAPKYDITGAERPVPASVGAMEYVEGENLACKIAADKAQAFSPDTITLTVALEGKRTEPIAYAWDFDGDGVTDSTDAEPVLSDIGVYAPSVTVTDATGKTASDAYPNRISVFDAARIVYVDEKAASPKAPYMSPETATASISDAVAAAPDGATVLVKRGRYVQQKLEVGRPIDLVGEGRPEETVIDLKGNRFEVLRDGNRIANLAFEGGDNAYCAGTFILGSAITVTNCIFRNAKVSPSGNSRYVMSLSGAARVVDCVVSNVVMSGAPGIYLSDARGVAENCLVTDCRLDVAVISGKTQGGAFNGAGCYRNCTAVDNGSLCTESAVNPCCDGKVSELRNCVFAGNYVMSAGGEKVACNDIAHVATTKASYCLVWPTAFDYEASGYTAVKTEDPRFNAKRPWHPTYASPCRNGGDKATPLMSTVDLDGNPRVVSKIVDLGCYECQRIPGLTVIVK